MNNNYDYDWGNQISQCYWTTEDQNELVGTLIVGPIIGVLIGLIMVILTSLPLCCGVMKAQGKVIAMIGIPLGIIACLFPLFLSMNVCPPFVEKMCEKCVDQNGKTMCDDDKTKNLNGDTTRQQFEASCAAIGWIAAYLFWGWAAVILGITASILSCCILCGCCKMKEETTFQDGAPQTSA